MFLLVKFLEKNFYQDMTTEKLTNGFLNQFTSLRHLEEALINVIAKQDQILNQENFQLNSLDEIAEISLMVLNLYFNDSLLSYFNFFLFQMKKMNLYRQKLKQIRSDMLYIAKLTEKLRQKAMNIQSCKVLQKAMKVQNYDYEKSLIAKSK